MSPDKKKIAELIKENRTLKELFSKIHELTAPFAVVESIETSKSKNRKTPTTKKNQSKQSTKSNLPVRVNNNNNSIQQNRNSGGGYANENPSDLLDYLKLQKVASTINAKSKSLTKKRNNSKSQLPVKQPVTAKSKTPAKRSINAKSKSSINAKSKLPVKQPVNGIDLMQTEILSQKTLQVVLSRLSPGEIRRATSMQSAQLKRLNKAIRSSTAEIPVRRNVLPRKAAPINLRESTPKELEQALREKLKSPSLWKSM